MQEPIFSGKTHLILEEINEFYTRFGEDSARYQTKAIGAVTNEVVRRHLEQEGIFVSNRNVFIDGLPTEWDLIVFKAGAVPKVGCVWCPADVLAVIEIKYSGLYDRKAIPRLKSTFSRLTQKHPHIKPFYFTLMETPSAQKYVSDETLGCRALTLHWYRQCRGEDVYSITKDWEYLVKDLQNL